MLTRRILKTFQLNKRYITGLPSKKRSESKLPNIANEFKYSPPYTLALTNWVIQPELEIYEFQSLMKASAFIVKAINQKTDDNQYHIVTTNHNVAPWLYPKYYPEDFMAHINENHTTYTVEIRGQNGDILTQLDIQPYIFHHPEKDLAVLHFNDEANSLELLNQLGYQFLEIETYLPEENEKLNFYGHEVFEKASNVWDGVTTKTENSLSAPKSSSGYLAGRTQHQTFVQTNPVFTPGMCGGIAVSNRGSICGMIEASVPDNHPQEILRNLGVIIDSKEILEFLKEVEFVRNNSLKYSDKVSILFGGNAFELLKDNTPDMSIYNDPMKVLHNQLYPEDISRYNQEFNSNTGRFRAGGPLGENNKNNNNSNNNHR